MSAISDMPLERIRDAERVVRNHLQPTPLVGLGERTTPRGSPIVLKAESVQPTGSFKVRGALNRIARLTQEERGAGIVAYSTGNHAQAVAWAARAAGVAATVVMSPDADRAKVAATRRLGAEVLMSAPRSDARRAMAEELAAARQAALVPPYDDLDVIAGQATIAAEIFQRTSGHGPTCIYVPIGGGGLLAGIAAAVRQMHPSTRVIGVEPELEADAFRSFHSGTLQRLEGPSDSIADAIKVQELGSLTWPIIREHVDDVVTVSEAEIAQACGLAADLANLVVEPGGAVGIAAALGHDDGAEPGAAVAIACGGNIELERLAALAAGERVAHG